MSYAQHQEQVAHALHRLICDPQPSSQATTGEVLGCRDQAIKALRERLHYLAGSGHDQKRERPNFTVASLAQRPVEHLSHIIEALPLPTATDQRPSQLLPGPDAAAAASTADRWRCLARNLLLGTAELTRADHQPWTHQTAAGWHLIGDTATTVEALLVLDDTLAATGILPAGSEQARMTQRLTAGHVVRLAHWFGTDHSADLATSGVRHELGVAGNPPVTMVRRAQDYAAAQRTLTALLQGHASLLRPGSDQRAGLTAARALATGQIRLAQTFATWADHAAEPELADQFRSRIPRWRNLHVSTSRLAEVEKRRSPLLLAQQSEMVMRLRSSLHGRLCDRELHDLNHATHELTVIAGRTLRREALQAQNIVTLDSEAIGLPKPKPMTNTQWAFTAVCQHLAEDPTPLEPPDRPVAAHERDQLRRTLEETAIGQPPPFRQMRPSPGLGRRSPGRDVSADRCPSL